MKSKVLLCALMVVPVLSDRGYACEMDVGFYRGAVARSGMPDREAIRVVGVVSGYGSITRPVGALSNRKIGPAAATVRVRIEQVVSGKINNTETEVAVLSVSASCMSAGIRPDVLQRSYPIGMAIAVFGEAIPGFNEPDKVAILAAMNQGGFVEAIPSDLKRIPTGELDFQKSYREVSQGLLEFEFDRALFALADAPIGERFSRLLNLADYPYSYRAFRDADREFFIRLVSESGVKEPEMSQLLQRFDAHEGRQRTR